MREAAGSIPALSITFAFFQKNNSIFSRPTASPDQESWREEDWKTSKKQAQRKERCYSQLARFRLWVSFTNCQIKSFTLIFQILVEDTVASEDSKPAQTPITLQPGAMLQPSAIDEPNKPSEPAPKSKSKHDPLGEMVRIFLSCCCIWKAYGNFSTQRRRKQCRSAASNYYRASQRVAYKWTRVTYAARRYMAPRWSPLSCE